MQVFDGGDGDGIVSWSEFVQVSKFGELLLDSLRQLSRQLLKAAIPGVLCLFLAAFACWRLYPRILQ